MNIWILVSLVILIIVSFISLKYRNSYYKSKYRKIFAVGIGVSLVYAIFWGSSLLDLIPELTIIDLLVGYLLGVITGFLLAVSLSIEKNR